MAQCTREQVNRWNAKLSNGFRLDLERFIVWNDKVATRSIELPDGKVLKADIGWTEVREEPRLGCFYQKTIGMMPRLSLSLWTPSSTPGMWCSRGLGAVVKITPTTSTRNATGTSWQSSPLNGTKSACWKRPKSIWPSFRMMW